ncbi:putative disease resistance protein RGA3 [Dichanthelium oligosanthes]|uniref:Putative disease resistance protein RGA3 n=1 Tax=Dichanthelium oligosanthes TaxID=888268 RepID=A0A1E5VAN7_9POAL|nr:putative disease resistance protein RGA3 [Dichanthelium oligosanthes]
MEAALASGLLKVAGDKLVQLISSEFASIMGVKKDLSELQDIHGEITIWLSLVRDRAIENDPSLRWVMKLRNVAYDIDDLLYEVQLEDEKQKMDIDDGKHSIFCCVYAKPKTLQFRCKVAHKIKEIKMKYAEILNQRSNTNTIMSNLLVDHPVGSRRIKRTIGEVSMLGNVEESKIPTRDQEKDKIMGKLLESNEGEDGLTISVVGIGGSGKTTLAKHICHDSNIKEHFKSKVFWVHVSQEFDVEKLISKLFEAIVEQKSDLHAQRHMLHEISNKLSGKKFLLVLDDAWHEDRNDWDQFMVHLKSGAPGSKILLTTRDRKVAESVKSSYIFDLAFLSEAESWNLFLKSSGCTEKELDYEFIQVGKETVNKCGGVPLAIKTLGGILCEKKEISTWRAISGSDLWNVKSIKDRVFVSLKLSYIHLADELKQCFTFCSIFPKGYEIYKDHLIALWIAHGFINPMNEEQSEDIGNNYFDSLVKVGFLHNPCESWNSKQLICRMHDLIHDLTRQILLDEVVTCLPNNVKANCTQRGRYLSLISCTRNVEIDLLDKVRALYIGGNPSFIQLVKKVSNVRSVTLQYTIDGWFPHFVLKFVHIRYLEIRNSRCTEAPDAISGCWNLQTLLFIDCSRLVTLPYSIGKLKKLRTLEISKGTDFESLPHSIGDCQDLQHLQLNSCDELIEIPKSISNIQNLRVIHIVRCPFVKELPSEFTGRLSNLQTINLFNSCLFQDLPSTFACDLEDCNKLVELPKGIGNLKRLKVFYIKGCCKLRCMPSGFGKLIHLRRLGLFIVGHAGDGASILELKNLDMVSGDMEITNLKDLKDSGDAEKACLKQKENIQNLTLTWSSNQIEEELVSDIEHDQGVLDALEPPSEIKTLSISGYRGPYLPYWMRNQSNSYCPDCVILNQSNSPQFHCLTEMKLEGLPNLKHMRGLSELPSLKSIYIYEMPNLEELWMTTTGLEIGEEKEGTQYCFPVLSHLFIKDCPRLNVKPYFTPSLEWMKLEKCDDRLLSSVSVPPHVSEPLSPCITHAAVSHLKELQLDRLTGSSSDWEFLQLFTGLESMEFDNCIELRQLPESMRRLTSLQKLSMYKCSSLVTLPEWFGELRCLQTLVVSDCPMMDRLPQSMEHLKSLVKLHISRLDNLKQLPETIQHLTSLQKLQLDGCRALTVLPEGVGQLSGLRWLCIQYCSALRSLPRSIERLTDLKSLFVAGCPGLVRRYDKELGTEWHLISHIPEVWIQN